MLSAKPETGTMFYIVLRMTRSLAVAWTLVYRGGLELLTNSGYRYW